ncbi:hypothetical protein Afil01_69150 [Actinorhabdospora filicis]|uniref:Peptidase inhibitor I9 n=1 Tax=Actinorhabdospora filicis TaxID=1785913 RepID=A0A9W6SU63_9ACTN|nr:S8 family serine peptidase [Actinorhabdospora filicis]GLZ82108.1 hypothetical protein Afil01_69150 [Actinorhabdospora filicis]
MSSQRRIGARTPVALSLTTAAVTAFALVGTGSAQADPGIPGTSPEYSAGTYIVALAGAPAASYNGGISGYAATKPDGGEKFDKNDPAVKAYTGLLARNRDAVLDKVPGADTVYTFDTTFNGMAVTLTAKEAATMAKTNGVVGMWKDEARGKDTVDTPTFLGLSGSNGVWQSQFSGVENAGEGVVVGVIDTGFWPENAAFGPLAKPWSAEAEEALRQNFTGTCDTGVDTPERNIECNDKVIAARYFEDGIRKSNTPPIAGEFRSPRDYGGHGSHTASTAAGNNGVDASIDGVSVGKISGMAPAARLSVYKACWETIDPDACAVTSDLVAAIEQATNDGVDVINYSISGSKNSVVDPVEMAFYQAAAAGIFVAASAGNSGPGASTVAHNSPWLTTVAASSHDRDFAATAVLGDGQKLAGAGRGAALPSAPVVLSKDIAAPGANPSDANLCAIGSLDPAKAAGKIVACQRGVVARTDKSIAVKNAGGVGMIQFNVPGGAADIAADFQAVPSVHLDATNGQKLLAYLSSTATPTASLEAGVQYKKRAPEMGSFSSAGPAIAGGGDLLKPDITAPGVDVIAAVSPAGNNGNNFQSYQGTSMSSPHIAGLAALVVAKHPDWSPMAVKSALMTTATTLDNAGKPIQRAGKDATPFDYGAGHVRIAQALDPGLVFDSNEVDWARYGCGLGQFQLLPNGPSICETVGSIDPSDLNYPSIAIGQLVGQQTVTRTVTNVSNKTETYFSTVEAPAGIKIAVDKKSIVLRPGQSATFKVTITRTDAAANKYAFGALTWKALQGHTVRSPIVVKPVNLSAPSEATGTGVTGSSDLKITPGFSGTLKTVATPLAADQAKTLTLSKSNEDWDANNPATSAHVGKIEFTVPASALFGRVATFDDDYGRYGDGTDVDLFVYRKAANGALTLLGNSAVGGSNETLTLAPGATYVVFADFFDGPAATQDILLHTWTVGAEGAAPLTVSPASTSVSVAAPVTLKASWTGLTAGQRYLGALIYLDGNNVQVGNSILGVKA